MWTTPPFAPAAHVLSDAPLALAIVGNRRRNFRGFRLMASSGFFLIYQSFMQRIVPKMHLRYKHLVGASWEK